MPEPPLRIDFQSGRLRAGYRIQTQTNSNTHFEMTVMNGCA